MNKSPELVSFQNHPVHYETVVTQAIRQCPASGAFIDCGAHAGQHTQTMLERPDVDRVYAVEAIPRLCEHLGRKFAAEPKLRLLQCAVTNRHGSGQFRIAKNAPGYSSLAQRDIAQVSEWEEIQVDLRRLDDLLAPEDLHRVGLIKLDIEGAEFPALAGASQIMLRSRPFVIFENGLKKVAEPFGYSWEDFDGMWQGLGYEVRDFFGNLVTRSYWDAIGQTYMYIAYPRDHPLEAWSRQEFPEIVRRIARG